MHMSVSLCLRRVALCHTEIYLTHYYNVRQSKEEKTPHNWEAET